MTEAVPLSADIKDLIDQCQKAKENSYCPYSKFRVGASLLTKDGKVINGCNVENIISILSVCAERCAFVTAVSEGHLQFKAIAVSSDLENEFIAPCGSCRQIMFEFGGNDMEVYITKPDKSWLKTTVGELMPCNFDGETLKFCQF